MWRRLADLVRGVATGVAVLVLASCAESPSRPAPALATGFADPSPVSARDRDMVVVRAAAADTPAVLAERYLGDRDKAFWLVERNGTDTFEAGQLVVIPLHHPNPLGVYAAGYQAVPILCYHRFGAKAAQLIVTPAAFDAQMSYLARNGYTVIPLARIESYLQGNRPLPRKTVAVTIDDGYRSTYEIAYPVLARHRLPATLFLYSDFVGAKDALNWTQMKEMQDSKIIDIQPHSKTHANLALRLAGETDAQYRERIRREVDVPVAAIRDRLAVASNAFAYPYGDVSDTVIDLLKRRGVRLGATVTPGGNGFFAHPYLLRRTMVYGTDSLETFKAKLVTFVPYAAR
jgi:peptidoglycan/xylan/chitin deacetylase (PgdA/CDA1 family)